MLTDDRRPEDEEPARRPETPVPAPSGTPGESEIPVFIRAGERDEEAASGSAVPPAPGGSGPSSDDPAKHPGRKKSGDPKAAVRIRALRSEIEILKNSLERTATEAEASRARIAAAEREIQDWKDKALRTLAESENLRKRLERDKNEFYQFALADILKDILRVLDNLERALGTEEGGAGFREGVELIRKQIFDLVAKRGVAPIERTDGRFDPTIHQALTTEIADGIEEPMIGEELQRGYMLNERLLRPALVKVLLPKKE
jgi:molecular chaperone GrpE